MNTFLHGTSHCSEPTPMEVDSPAIKGKDLSTTHNGFNITVKDPSLSTFTHSQKSEIKNLFQRKISTAYPFNPSDSGDVSTHKIKVLSFSTSHLDPSFMEATIVEKDVEPQDLDKIKKLHQDRISLHEALKTLVEEDGLKGDEETHLSLLRSSPYNNFSGDVYYTHSQAPGVKEYLSVALQKFTHENGFNPFCIILGQRSVPFVINSEEVEKAGGLIFSILENYLRYSCTSPTESEKRMFYGDKISKLVKKVINSNNKQDLAELEKVIPFNKLVLFINTEPEKHGESGKHKVSIENESELFDSKSLNAHASGGSYRIDDQDLEGFSEIDNVKDLAKFLEKGLRISAVIELSDQSVDLKLLHFALESNISTVYNKIRLASDEITVNTSASDDKNNVYLGDTFDPNWRTNTQFLIVDEDAFKNYDQKTTDTISHACNSISNLIQKHRIPTVTSAKTPPDVRAANTELVKIARSMSDGIDDCSSQLLVHCRKTNPKNRIQTTFSNIDSIDIPAKKFLIINKRELENFFKNKQKRICKEKIEEVKQVHSCTIPTLPAFSPYTVCKRVESDQTSILHTVNPHALERPGTVTSVFAKFTQKAKLFPYFSETSERAEVGMFECDYAGGGRGKSGGRIKLLVRFSSSEKPRSSDLQFLGTVLQDSNSGALRNTITMNTDKEEAIFCDSLDEAEKRAERLDFQGNYSIYVKGKGNKHCQKLTSNHFPFGLNYELKFGHYYT